MSQNRIAVVIPFRDRGSDPLRQANLDTVLDHWKAYTRTPLVVSDGGYGDAQFNRSAAYNRGAEQTDADVLIFTESDMLIDFDQIDEGVCLARQSRGLVVPFTLYRYLSPEDSAWVRAGELHPLDATPETTMENGQSIGAINIVSRETFNAVGQYDEGFKGSWWDDRAMKIAFEVTSGPTRWVTGPAHHIYHKPGWKGSHLTDEDKRATERNKRRFMAYRRARTAEQIRALTTGA